jgi:2-C-methyl-D-erythritol 4-phosphate cytidylyltransferase
MRGQTPQGFRVGVIRKAHEMASRDRFTNATDDCALVLRYGLADIYVIKGAEDNIKITYMTDVFLADKLFQLRSVPATHVMRLEEIKGKVVVVFGASRGIGRAIMQTAKKAGARAYGFSRHDGVDVSSITDVEKALRKVYGSEKRIDYVVNTAGIMHTGRIEDMAFEDIVSEIKVNFTGSINVLKQGIRYLKKTKGAILLFTSSSYTRGRAMYSVYSSTKAAVVNLVQAVAEELLPEGIRINAINPERTATPMRREHFGKEPEESLLRPEYVAAVSLKTLLSGITGQVIDIRKEDD